jgi:cytochrome c oxidase assembly protein subunit 11
MYAVAIAIAVTGLSYAAVPLYRIFCQASGYGGTVVKAAASEKVEAMEPIREREITIR